MYRFILYVFNIICECNEHIFKKLMDSMVIVWEIEEAVHDKFMKCRIIGEVIV